jgi:hypothetical protein
VTLPSTSAGRLGLIGLLATLALALAGALGTARAAAEETVWLCKPGISDNPCLDESLSGSLYLPEFNGEPERFDYRPARSTRFDCFYVYPTQSEQETPNANLDRDPELKRVAVNQASQFSRLCRVFAPVYRQYTFTGEVTEEVRDIAYEGVRDGFYDYLRNHSRGRGFVLIGHSQGASHLSRLIDEEIDGNRRLRERMISAIVPGSNNIYVPKGEVIGGNLAKIPACTGGSQLGCVMAWSLYLDRAGEGLLPGASFGRLENGYWIYPEERPDPDQYEVLCTNPAALSGGSGVMDVLANLGAFAGNLGAEAPWDRYRGFYRSECRTGPDASWLDMTEIPGIGSNLSSILGLITRTGGDLHLGDLNLVLGNLIEIVRRQGNRYLDWRAAGRRVVRLERRLATAKRARAKASGERRAAISRKVRVIRRQLAAARAQVRAYRPSGGSSSA